MKEDFSNGEIILLQPLLNSFFFEFSPRLPPTGGVITPFVSSEEKSSKKKKKDILLKKSCELFFFVPPYLVEEYRSMFFWDGESRAFLQYIANQLLFTDESAPVSSAAAAAVRFYGNRRAPTVCSL